MELGGKEGREEKEEKERRGEDDKRECAGPWMKVHGDHQRVRGKLDGWPSKVPRIGRRGRSRTEVIFPRSWN